jgi:hypothetical protein
MGRLCTDDHLGFSIQRQHRCSTLCSATAAARLKQYSPLLPQGSYRLGCPESLQLPHGWEACKQGKQVVTLHAAISTTVAAAATGKRLYNSYRTTRHLQRTRTCTTIVPLSVISQCRHLASALCTVMQGRAGAIPSAGATCALNEQCLSQSQSRNRPCYTVTGLKVWQTSVCRVKVLQVGMLNSHPHLHSPSNGALRQQPQLLQELCHRRRDTLRRTARLRLAARPLRVLLHWQGAPHH